MKISEAINLKARLEKELSRLYSQAEKVSVVSMKPDENYTDYISTTVDKVLAEIDQYSIAIIALSNLIRNSNFATLITFEGNSYSVTSAIQSATLNRRKVRLLETLASKPKRERDAYRDNDLVNVATYEVDMYKLLAKTFSDKVERLSALIDDSNQKGEIDFDLSKYVTE